MSLAGYQNYEQRDFGGAWPFLDMATVDERGALLSKNCEYVKGEVNARPGYAMVYFIADLSTGPLILGMFGWISELGNYVIIFGNFGWRIFLVSSASIVPQRILGSPFVLAAIVGSMASFGTRFAIVNYATQQSGAVFNGLPPHIVSLISSAFTADYIAPGPMAYTPSAPTEPGAGVITAGMHRLGYRVITRSGWAGRPSPDSSSVTTPNATTFTPIVFTSAGLKNLSWTLNPPNAGWPVDAVQVQVISSIVTNPNRYFLVPGAIATLSGGGGTSSATIVWSISDDDLQAQGIECTNSLNNFSNPTDISVAISTCNTATPIKVTTASPHGVGNNQEVVIYGVLGQTGANGRWVATFIDATNFTLQGSTSVGAYTSGGYVTLSSGYGAMMNCWMVSCASNRAYYVNKIGDGLGGYIDQLYISEPGDYQTFTPDLHVLQIPGLRNIRSVFSMLGSVYLVGPHWTYVTSDTGDVPASWPGPFLVDGQKGTLYPGGTAVSPSGRYAWIADTAGLYFFDGAYASLPISYLQTTEWQKIDWPSTIGYGMVIKDNAEAHKVCVNVYVSGVGPLLYTWDYTNGMDPYQVKFSIDDVGGAGPYSMDLVQNDTSATVQQNGVELWWGSMGQITRQTGVLTPAIYRDTVYNGSTAADIPIHWQYETMLHPAGGSGGNWFKYGAAHYRVRGAGNLSVTVYAYDRKTSAGPYTITLASAPGFPVLQRFDLNSPGAFHHFETNTLDTQCSLSVVRTYYAPWAGHF